MPLVTADTLHRVLVTIYLAKDVPPDEAEIVARHQTSANLAGHDSHGVIRTPIYVERIERGHIVPGAEFVIEEETASTAVINGNWGFGFVQTERAVELAIDKARSSGVAAVTIRYQGHMGRLGAYMETIAGAGMIGLMAADSGRGPKAVVPLGGRVAKLGTNPICFGVPTGGPPIVLDMATSAVAGGKVQVMRNSGQSLDPGLLLDSDGNPTTDPNDYFSGGALLPFGGAQAHKGFGLSVIVEILCGVLTGLGFGVAADSRHNDGNFIALFDVARFRDPDEFRDDVDAFIADLKSTPLAAGHEEIFYPGEIEVRTTADRLVSGIQIDDGTWGELLTLIDRIGLDRSILPTS
jgi:LDH2 family malate/lactate/ureidoglycolate dehydrogenase